MDLKESDKKVELTKKKTHKYKYYKIVKTITNSGGIETDEVFDFENWLIEQKTAIDEKETLNIDNMLYRIHKSEFLEERYYVIKFYKYRLEQEIEKLKEREPVEIIKLNNDEYVGEPTMFLYDVIDHRCMVKLNRYSLSEKDYIRIFESYVKPNENIKLTSFIDPNFEIKLRKGGFKKIELSMFRLNEIDGKIINKNGSLKQWITGVQKAGGNSLNITIGLGHSRNGFLNRKKTTQIIEDIGILEKFVRMAKARINNNGKIEEVDILTATLKSEIEYIINPRGSVEYNIEKIEMLAEYKKIMK